MSRWVALLRGVNVGGNNKLPMRDLAEILREAGAEDVSTFIQSGNALFSATEPRAREVAAVLPERIGARLGIRPPVLLRSAAAMRAIVDGSPYAARAVDPDRVYVSFLADPPSAAAVASLDPSRSPPDEVTVVGSEAWLYFPNGLGKSKITNQYLDSRLHTVSTTRNWRTVRKLAELAAR